MRVIFFHQFIKETGDAATGRALKVAEFFQRDRRLWVAANVHRFGITFSGDALVFGHSETMRQPCAIEHRSAPQRRDRDHGNNNKRQITLHKSVQARKV
jgi:hypothetical protein